MIVWHDGLGQQFGTRFLDEFGTTVKDDPLRQQFGMMVWDNGLGRQLGMTVWDGSLGA